MPPQRGRRDASPETEAEPSPTPEDNADVPDQSSSPPSRHLSAVRRRPQELATEFLRALEQDVDELLQDFVKMETVQFRDFERLWKMRDFSLVFIFGFTFLSTSRILSHLYEYLFEQQTDGADERLQCAVIFATYSLYYSQPCDKGQVPCPIPIAEEHLRTLRAIFSGHLASSEEFRDARSALWHLFTDDAFQLTFRPPSADRARANADTLGVYDLESSELMEVPARNLHEQVQKIDAVLQADPILACDPEELLRIARAYDNLAASLALVMPDLRNISSAHKFVDVVEGVRREYTSASASIGNKSARRMVLPKTTSKASVPCPTSGRSNTLVPLPHRPATAPPCVGSRHRSVEGAPFPRSDSPALTLGHASDMPDFSFFNSLASPQHPDNKEANMMLYWLYRLCAIRSL